MPLVPQFVNVDPSHFSAVLSSFSVEYIQVMVMDRRFGNELVCPAYLLSWPLHGAGLTSESLRSFFVSLEAQA